MVNIFGIKFEDPVVDIAFWTVFIAYIFLDTVVIIVTSKKIINELKAQYCDFL